MALLERLARAWRKAPPPSEPAAVASPELLPASHWIERGNRALQADDWPTALDCYRRACEADPHSAPARLNFGFVLLEQGQAAQARQVLQDCLAMDDAQTAPDACFLGGRAALQLGDAVGARELFEQAVRLKPDFEFAWGELAQLHESVGDVAQAIAGYEQLARLQGATGPAALQLARALLSQRRPLDALQWLPADSPLDERWKARAVLRAQALVELHRFEDALSLVEQVLAADPAEVSAWVARGNVMARLRRAQPAIDSLRRAVDLAPDDLDVRATLGAALQEFWRCDEALVELDRVLAVDPSQRQALFNKGRALVLMLRLDEASQVLQEAVRRYPDDAEAHWNLSIAHLLAGRLAPGWEEHEWRRGVVGSSLNRLSIPTDVPQWAGEDLAGKTLLVCAEQGLGDSIQMLRYLGPLGARATRVRFELHPALAPFAQQFPANCEAVPMGSRPASDLWCPVMSLPRAFGTTLESIPAQVPYLRVDPERRQAWAARLGGRRAPLRVGIAWSGSSTHQNDLNRSIPLELLRACEWHGCELVSLQKELRPSDEQAIAAWTGLQHFGDELADMMDTAALIDSLDLVVSVDTSVAHLAGALGKPVWLMLSFLPDWRWMIGRADSPWYPTARLFRQAAPMDWSPVLADVQAAIARCLRDRPDAAGGVARVGDEPPARAYTRQPPRWRTQVDEGNRLLESGDVAQAVPVLEAAVEQSHGHVAARQALGNAFFRLHRHERALQQYDQVLAVQPTLVPAMVNRATCLNRLGRFEEALVDLDRALAIEPNNKLGLSNRLLFLIDLGRVAEAADYAERAMARLPDDADLRLNAAVANLTAGRWVRAWPLWEARWTATMARAPQVQNVGKPRWHGEPLAGKTLLLQAEQGFGDTLQFIRYVRVAQTRGARVVLTVPPALHELARTVSPDCTVLTDGDELPAVDYVCPLLSAPMACGTTPETAPAIVPYLSAPPQARDRWRERLGPKTGFRIGVAWSGNEGNVAGRQRAMPLSLLRGLELPGCEFISLQKEVRASDQGELADWKNLRHFGADLHSFADTAALAEQMDLVISVDTSVAHLAGALGRPLWLLLAYECDWRWMRDREDSVWYPTARLFRQGRDCSWPPVLLRVRTALEALRAGSSEREHQA